MNKRFKFTVIIPALNEEARIAEALKRLNGRAHLLVHDDCSTDKTAEIAKSFGAEVVTLDKTKTFSKQWYEGLFALVQTDYILLHNLAHTHTRELLDLYEKIADEQVYKAVAMYQTSSCYGRRINSWRTPYECENPTNFMFFDKNYVDTSLGKIHQEYPFIGKPEQMFYPPKSIKYCVRAFRDDNAESNDLKHTRYANTDALHRFESGERTNWIKLIAMFCWHFGKSWIWRKSIFQGVPGLITSYWVATYMVNVQIRLWELQNGWTRKKIREDHQRMKEVIR
jgi:glycosyltransferase involved in cell wall biosynthesis